MKVRFFVDVYPGYKPEHLSARTQNDAMFTRIPGHKRLAFDVELPEPQEIVPVDGIVEAVEVEESGK